MGIKCFEGRGKVKDNSNWRINTICIIQSGFSNFWLESCSQNMVMLCID